MIWYRIWQRSHTALTLFPFECQLCWCWEFVKSIGDICVSKVLVPPKKRKKEKAKNYVKFTKPNNTLPVKQPWRGVRSICEARENLKVQQEPGSLCSWKPANTLEKSKTFILLFIFCSWQDAEEASEAFPACCYSFLCLRHRDGKTASREKGSTFESSSLPESLSISNCFAPVAYIWITTTYQCNSGQLMWLTLTNKQKHTHTTITYHVTLWQ